MAKEYTSIKVRAETHSRILAFRHELLVRGTNSLPRDVPHPAGSGLSDYIELALDLAEKSLDRKAKR